MGESGQEHKRHRRKLSNVAGEEKGRVLPGRISQGRRVFEENMNSCTRGDYLDRQISKLDTVNSCLETIDRLHPVSPLPNSFQ